jgi:hypothetical protein
MLGTTVLTILIRIGDLWTMSQSSRTILSWVWSANVVWPLKLGEMKYEGNPKINHHAWNLIGKWHRMFHCLWTQLDSGGTGSRLGMRNKESQHLPKRMAKTFWSSKFRQLVQIFEIEVHEKIPDVEKIPDKSSQFCINSVKFPSNLDRNKKKTLDNLERESFKKLKRKHLIDEISLLDFSSFNQSVRNSRSPSRSHSKSKALLSHQTV